MLEGGINCAIKVFRCIEGGRWGATVDPIFSFHTTLVRHALAYSLPVLLGFFSSKKSRLNYMLARSLRVCLGLPRTKSTALILTSAKEPFGSILKPQKCIVFFF